MPPNYFDAMDYPGILAEYGRPEEFLTRMARLSPENLARSAKRSVPPDH